MSRRLLLYRFLPLFLLAAVLAACGSSHPVSQTVATVYHRPIQRAAVDRYLGYAVAFDALAYPDSAEAGCTRQPAKAACVRLRSQVLGRLIQERVVLSYARTRHIALDSRDLTHVAAQLKAVSAPGSPTGKLFRNGEVTRAFMRSVLERQVLVQKVESAIAGERAVRGMELHIRKLLVPAAAGASRQNLYQQTVSIAGGGPVPPGTTELYEWVAPFRLPATLRTALSGSHRGDYVGPFQKRGGFLLVQYLGKQIHPYGRPARDQLTSQYFAAWLRGALQNAHPRCLNARGRLAGCPAAVINKA